MARRFPPWILPFWMVTVVAQVYAAYFTMWNDDGEYPGVVFDSVVAHATMLIGVGLGDILPSPVCLLPWLSVSIQSTIARRQMRSLFNSTTPASYIAAAALLQCVVLASYLYIARLYTVLSDYERPLRRVNRGHQPCIMTKSIPKTT